MRTSLTDAKPQLLVDIETGRILRGDDQPVISRRLVDAHPFIELEGDSVFVGPEAKRAAAAHSRGETLRTDETWQYEIHSEVAGALHLQRVETI